MSDTTPCYVGVSRASCGHWVAAMVDDEHTQVNLTQRRRERAKELADWARRGLIIERHTVAEVRERLDWCVQCCPKVMARERRDAQATLPLGASALGGAPR